MSCAAPYEVEQTGSSVPVAAVEPYSSWPDELRGRTLRVQTDQGTTNIVNLAPDGTMTMQVEPGQPVIEGT